MEDILTQIRARRKVIEVEEEEEYSTRKSSASSIFNSSAPSRRLQRLNSLRRLSSGKRYATSHSKEIVEEGRFSSGEKADLGQGKGEEGEEEEEKESEDTEEEVPPPPPPLPQQLPMEGDSKVIAPLPPPSPRTSEKRLHRIISSASSEGRNFSFDEMKDDNGKTSDILNELKSLKQALEASRTQTDQLEAARAEIERLKELKTMSQSQMDLFRMQLKEANSATQNEVKMRKQLEKELESSREAHKELKLEIQAIAIDEKKLKEQDQTIADLTIQLNSAKSDSRKVLEAVTRMAGGRKALAEMLITELPPGSEAIVTEQHNEEVHVALSERNDVEIREIPEDLEEITTDFEETQIPADAEYAASRQPMRQSSPSKQKFHSEYARQLESRVDHLREALKVARKREEYGKRRSKGARF